MLDSMVDLVVEVEERFRPGSRSFLFLDFDGTLAPIEADFARPRLDAAASETLAALAALPSLVTTIISGRAVEDVFARIRVEGLIYAGNHGMEIFGRDLRFVEPLAAGRRAQLERLSRELAERLRPIPGAQVEAKGLTTCVHYRNASEDDQAAIIESVRRAAERGGALFRLIHGLKAIEILPRTNWHKGAAAQWILERFGAEDALTIYAGDDAGDEEAFAALRGAVTVKVGRAQPTLARYWLPHPAAVREFLRWLSILVAASAQRGAQAR